jgi:hypothetical protein
MKSIKEKYNDLLKEGFTKKTLNNLDEKQISHLHGVIVKPVNEQIKTTTKQVKTTTIPSNVAKTTGANIGSIDIKTDSKGDVIATQMDETKKPGKDTFKSLGKSWTIKDAENHIKKIKNSVAYEAESMSHTDEMNLEKLEKDLKEFKAKDKFKPVESVDEQIESYIVKLVERHILPKMSKKDLLTMVEQKPVETPVKPDVKPDTKPTTRPAHPFRHPRPGNDPAPKAKKSDEKIKKDIMDIISKILKGDEE